MIHVVDIHNFKPFGRPQHIHLSTINLVYGPNSAGKSSLIQSLMLLRQSTEPHGTLDRLVPRGEYVDLGSFGAFIYKHDYDREFSISIKYDPPYERSRVAERLPTLQRHESTRVSLRFRASPSAGSRKKDSSELGSVRYQAKGAVPLDMTLAREHYDPKSTTIGLRRAAFRVADEASLKSYLDYAKQLDLQVRRYSSEAYKRREELWKLTDIDFKYLLARARFYSYGCLPSVPEVEGGPEERPIVPPLRPVDDVAYEFQALLQSLSYLGPLRSHPARHYIITGTDKATVGVRGENTPHMLFRRKDEIQSEINAWFSRFGIPYSIHVSNIGDSMTGEIISIALKDRRSGITVAPSDVGFGIGQLLPIIVEGAVARRRILCVEQPEIHLHPRLQAHIADFLIETAGLVPTDKRGTTSFGSLNQWIVETHSEALMLRLQRRIRERRLRPEDVTVLYVQPIEDGSMVMPLRLDDEGEFVDEWPGGFFEDGFRELFDGRSE